MKYIVELKYTNPAHEHISLRRRVDTVNRIVEAASEDEAINRAANQQRALGFTIKEAKIITIQKPEVASVIQESKKEDATDKADKEKDDEEDSDTEDMKEGIAADMLASKREKAQKKIADMLLKRDMETTKKERADKRQAGTMKPVKEEAEVQYIEEKLTASDPASKWISDFVASDNPKFAGKSKKERIQQALGAYYAAKRGKNEEVEIDEATMRVVNKEVKGEVKDKDSKEAETTINLAKSKKNKVNAKPSLDVTSAETKYAKV